VEKIKTTLVVDLQVTDFFNYSTIRELTSHLVSEIQRQGVVLPDLEAEAEAERAMTVDDDGALAGERSSLQIQGHTGEEGVLDVFARVRSGELDVAEARALLGKLEDEGRPNQTREGVSGNVWER